jgi:electron transfer flavoprotein beta subunit
MKILIAVKRVPDYQAKVRIAPDGKGIVADGIKWIVNPFDEIAVEEGVRIKEKGGECEVVVLSIGPDDAQQQLRYALAMGADRAILVKSDAIIDSYTAAMAIAAYAKLDNYSLILMGKQAIDSDCNQTAQMVAEILQWPQACFASKIQITADEAVVEREVDGGIETVLLQLPAVISADLRLNEPRYASLPNIMKAKKKTLDFVDLNTLVPNIEQHVEIVKLEYPPGRKGGRKVASVEDLVRVLKEEYKVV